jgi:outer membrane protein insertion porin family
VLVALAWLVGASGSLMAQQDRDPSEGKPIVEIFVEPKDQAELVIRLLRTRVGQPLRLADVKEDEEMLWRRLKLTTRVDVQDVANGVNLYFVLLDAQGFDSYEIHGLRELSEREVRTLLGLEVRQRMNRRAADQYAATLTERYKRKGYAFVQVRIQEDAEASVLHFWVDEGPKVRVDDVRFLGNESFPGWIALGMADNVGGSSKMQMTQATAVPFLIPGAEYSEEILDEDLDRLRVWYRQRGFRDARVELVSTDFEPDRSRVDLTIRIIEGRRYKIASVDLLQIPSGGGEPRYPKSEILAKVKTTPGQFYEWLQIDLDNLAIARFYGERGHPREGQYGRAIPDAFRIEDPAERFDVDRAEVHLTYVVREGSPKVLRAVQVRGNAQTQARVVLRKIFQMPGQKLDLTELERSQGVLDSLRYFSNAQGFGGTRFELLPVEGSTDQVDLAVDVEEGDTGQLLWGGGVSSFNVQARVNFVKRNFDIAKPPSSWNPVDWFTEIGNNQAFHGAGQELNILLSPGTQVSLFDISFFEPDLFRTHMDTIGLRVDAYRRLVLLDSFRSDSFGIDVGLSRQFTENFSVGLAVREESVRIRDIQANAPGIVFDAEGTNEIRGFSLNSTLADLDYPLEPTHGYRLGLTGEFAGGLIGGDESFVKFGLSHTQFFRLWRDARERSHVLRWRSSFDWGQGFGDSDDLFITERFYMGGANLRGFDQRRAGPFQFGRPVGGEARLLSSLEYRFPIFSTRRQGQLRETEVLRGHLFADFGMLGLSLDDLGSPRLSLGVGIRFLTPMLNAPLEFNVGWPVSSEDADEMRQFFFSISRN